MQSIDHGGAALRETATAAGAVSRPPAPAVLAAGGAARPPKPPAALLTAADSAQVLGISERKFHQLRDEPWMPRPVVLGPRLLRWRRIELESAAEGAPRQESPAKAPAQLAAGKARAKAARMGAPV